MTVTARLAGLLKVARSDLSIGVAVFSTPETNGWFVAETSAELTITDFLRMDHDEGYEILTDVPLEVLRRTYRRGDAVPIPVFTHGTCAIVHSDEDLPRLPGGSREELALVEDVRSILRNARTGVFRERDEARRSNDFEQEFEDLLSAEPVRSPHWVRRLSAAVRALGAVPAARRTTFLGLLSEKTLEWLRRFRGKAEPGLLLRILELAEEEILSPPDLASMLVETSVALASGDNWDLLGSDDFAGMVLRQSRSGFYGLEQLHGQDPEWPFRGGFNTLAWFNRLFDAWKDEYGFERLWRLSILAFGEKDPPAGDIDRYRSLYRFERTTLEQRIRDDLKTFFIERRHANEWSDHALHLLRQENALRYLKRVYDGSQRLPGSSDEKVDDPRTGFAQDLAMYVDGDVRLPGFDASRTMRARREAAAVRLPMRVSDWLSQHGPGDPDEARQLLAASFGGVGKPYSGKLRHDRLELSPSLGIRLTIKGKERIRAFRYVVTTLVESLRGDDDWKS